MRSRDEGMVRVGPSDGSQNRRPSFHRSPGCGETRSPDGPKAANLSHTTRYPESGVPELSVGAAFLVGRSSTTHRATAKTPAERDGSASIHAVNAPVEMRIA